MIRLRMSTIWMLALVLLLLPLILTGCTTTTDITTDWATTTAARPDDRPKECVEAPPARPKRTAKNYTALEADTLYRKLEAHDDEMGRRYRRCRVWSQGQR